MVTFKSDDFFKLDLHLALISIEIEIMKNYTQNIKNNLISWSNNFIFDGHNQFRFLFFIRPQIH